MIKRLICWIWGHKIIVKAYTGHTMPVTNPLTEAEQNVAMYKWEKMKFCLRCGKDVVPQ